MSKSSRKHVSGFLMLYMNLKHEVITDIWSINRSGEKITESDGFAAKLTMKERFSNPCEIVRECPRYN